MEPIDIIVQEHDNNALQEKNEYYKKIRNAPPNPDTVTNRY